MNNKKFLRKQKHLFSSERMKYYIVFLIGVLVTILIVSFFDHYTLQSPVVLRPFWKERYISPIAKNTVIEYVRRDTIENFSVSPTPTKVPKPTVVPTKAPKKRSPAPAAYAAEEESTPDVPRAYPYENKVAFMDAGQKDVMVQVEQKLGKAYAELIFREAGFHPLSVNSSSGACGLAQALPCSKMACELADVDCQLNWIKSYVERRYTNIENALLFHDQKGWY